MNPLRAVDLCCGSGGWAVAARGLPIRIELAIDWWDAACCTYALNHPETTVVRADLKSPPLGADAAGRFDLIVGAIPCEWLSKYRNWSDRSAVKNSEVVEGRALLDSVLRLVRQLRPRWWVLEDVAGLARELPPLTPNRVLDAARFSGQRRKRLFVGEFPAVAMPRDDRTLRDYLRPGPYRVGRRLLGRTASLTRTFSRDTCLAAEPDRKAPTVCSNEGRRDGEVGVVDARVPGGLRQFDWREMAALQGYPDDYLFYGSLTDVTKQVGGSIQIDCGRAILQAIVDAAASGEGGAAA